MRISSTTRTCQIRRDAPNYPVFNLSSVINIDDALFQINSVILQF